MSYDQQAYDQFLASKLVAPAVVGIDVPPGELHPILKPFQRGEVSISLRRGRSAIFQDCGMGKTVQFLEWARQLLVRGIVPRVLGVAPLNVLDQIREEGRRLLGFDVGDARDGSSPDGFSLVNYERLHLIDPSRWPAVVLDESSLLKAYGGKTRTALIERFAGVPWKLCATATPAPNDVVELQNHALFLEIPGADEMLARWFVTDPTQAGAYRLKRHAVLDFWRWVSSWGRSASRPSDLGDYSDDGYNLPPLTIVDEVVEVDLLDGADDGLFRVPCLSATELHREQRRTAAARAVRVRDVVRREPDEPWVIWVNTDYEADAIRAELPEIVELSGRDDEAAKLAKLRGFVDGSVRILLTKPKLGGFGLNWQHCARVVYSGLSYSYEQRYQTIRREWRFGQLREVFAYIVRATTEEEIHRRVEEKAVEHEEMRASLAAVVRIAGRATAGRPRVPTTARSRGEGWELWQGDCVEVLAGMPESSVGMVLTSPPFSSLYTYSDALQDLGNSASDEEFFTHFRYAAKALLRVTKPGRLCVLHCKDLPRYQGTHGRSGIYDFPGRLVVAMEDAGWQYHARTTIWKCPADEMRKTNSHGLLHLQLCKDSSASRMGLPDYLLAFRKWGLPGEEFPDPVVGHEPRYRFRIGEYAGSDPPAPPEYLDDRDPQRAYSIQVWRKYASPVWMDIRMTDVLDSSGSREPADERHICPIQLQVVSRAIHLWSNPGDVVIDPFGGIGSIPYVAVDLGRRGVAIELKDSYLRQAEEHLRGVDFGKRQRLLFA